ncbi:MAG TPA: hypothetical protein VF092_08190 [Longimicrobium sp.]
MPIKEAIRPLLEQLLEIQRAAFELREHETAFHALSAAAHAADSLEDMEMLDRIARLSRDELAWLDAHDPRHRLSTESANSRHHHSVFEQLGVTATNMRKRLHAERVRQESARAAGDFHG